MQEDIPKMYLYKRIVQAKLFMDARFAEPIDLGNIADEACFSKFHFIRLFKKIYGSTPHQYLISVRIENAKVFLQQELSVTDTCYAVGFDSLSSFTGLFRRITKSAPSAYLRHFKNRREQIKRAPLQFIPACFAAQKGWTEKAILEKRTEQ